MSRKFDPDWVIAPAETLKEWLEEHGLSVRVAAAALGRERMLEGVAAIEAVLARHELDEDRAYLLERCTGIPRRFWLALEQNYRAGLAAGKHEFGVDANP